MNGNKRNKGKSNQTDTSLFRERLRKRCKELNITHRQLAERAGISESIIDKWLNGKQDDATGERKFVPPSFDKLKRVADALGVSLDYFVNPDMDCLTVTHQMISDYTGLSDTAIHNLHCDHIETDKYNRSLHHFNDTINFLLCDKDGMEVLTTMYQYLFGNYVATADGKNTIDVLDNSGIPANGGTMDISNLNAVFLAVLTQNLAQIKGNLDTVPKAKYYGKYNPDTASERQQFFSDIPPFVV